MNNDCWNWIGVEGDLSCPKLKTVIHCRNCPVYSMAGRGLLEREAPGGYLEEWTDVLAKSKAANTLVATKEAIVRTSETISVMVFCLGEEWLAIPVQLLQEVTQPCIIQKLPHRSNLLFLGLVNIRGEILLCVSLENLLNLEDNASAFIQKDALLSDASKRMIVIASEENRWVFPVDRVLGVHRFQLNELQNTPVVISKASAAYTKGIINWQQKRVNYLDSDLLFYTLSRRIL